MLIKLVASADIVSFKHGTEEIYAAGLKTNDKVINFIKIHSINLFFEQLATEADIKNRNSDEVLRF